MMYVPLNTVSWPDCTSETQFRHKTSNLGWHHSGAWPSLTIDATTAWDAMREWYTASKRVPAEVSGICADVAVHMICFEC